MILYGASGHAEVVLDILVNLGIAVDVIFDDQPKCGLLFNVKVQNAPEKVDFQKAIISIGNNTFRKKISERFQLDYQTAIHPDSTVSQFSQIGEGTVVMAKAVINPGSRVGKHCIVNTGAIVEHDCVVGDFAHISPNAALAGNVTVGEGSHIGIGASVIQGVKIGKWATIGAGAVIIKDVPDFATVVGNPGKIIKTN